MNMKKIYLLCALLLAGLSASAQCPVFVDNDFTFSTQASIDNFTTDYPGCTSLGTDDFDVVNISGNDITNLTGLSGVTFFKSLWITGTELTTLEDLSTDAVVESTFLISGNASLTTCAVPVVCNFGLVIFFDNGAECTTEQVAIDCNPLPPLPVTLINFTARREQQTSILTWATTSETNSNRFEIQRSKTGKDWNVLGSVKAQGESHFTRQYSFIDARPLGGNNLYRLKMIDNDETFAYSTIRSLDAGYTETASIFPNPVNDQFQIQGTEPNATRRIKIYNTAGVMVFESAKRLVSNIDIKHLPAGMYVLQVIDSQGQSRNLKFAKK